MMAGGRAERLHSRRPQSSREPAECGRPKGTATVDIPSTDAALFQGIQSQSPDKRATAWRQFEDGYRPVIFAWCRRWRLSEADAEDLCQEILLKLSQMFHRRYFDPDRGRFRSLLYTMVGNALRDFKARQRQQPDNVDGRTMAELAAPAAADALSEMITDHPKTRAAQAVARVRAQVELEVHWRAFLLRHLERKSSVDIAAETGLTVGNVNKILTRLKKRIEEELGDA